MNEVTPCAGPVSTNANCAGVTGSGRITYHVYVTLLCPETQGSALLSCTCTLDLVDSSVALCSSWNRSEPNANSTGHSSNEDDNTDRWKE